MDQIGDILKNQKKQYLRPRYTVVLHNVRANLGLSLNEYVVIDSVHKLSHTDANYRYCIMSKDNIAKFLGLSRRTIFNAITTGLEKGLMEKNERGDLRTTKRWIDLVELFSVKTRK